MGAWESWPHWHRCGRAGPSGTEVKIWWDHNPRISMTQGNSRIAERCFSEGPILMLYQKPETLNQTNGLFAMYICKQSCFCETGVLWLTHYSSQRHKARICDGKGVQWHTHRQTADNCEEAWTRAAVNRGAGCCPERPARFFNVIFSFSFSNFFNLNLIFLFPFRGKVKRVGGRHGRTRK